jgi:hypothetical protein
MRDPTKMHRYCQQQAQDCLKASESSAFSEVRRAFLDLEQGWLQLIPETERKEGAIELKPIGRKRRKAQAVRSSSGQTP